MTTNTNDSAPWRTISAIDAGASQGEENFLKLDIGGGVSCKCTPRAKMYPRVTFLYRVGEGAVFNLGGLGGILYDEYTND